MAYENGVKPKHSFFFVSIGILLCILVGLFFFDLDDNRLLSLLSVMADFIVLYGVYFFGNKTGSFINQYSFFWISLSLYTFGQVILFSMGLKYELLNMFTIYDTNLLNQYLIYAILSFLVLLFSGSFVIKENDKFWDSCGFRPCCEFCWKIRGFFVLLFLISSPFAIESLVAKMSIASAYGYTSVYDMYRTSAFSESMSMWFVPSIFGLIYCYKNTLWKYFFIACLMIPVVCNLVIGSRSRPIAILLCLLFFWNASIKKIEKKKIVILGICSFFLLLTVVAVSRMRNDAIYSVSGIVEILHSYGMKGVVESSFGEMGSTMQVWLRLQHIVPEHYEYFGGISYVSAFLSCVPSFFLSGFSFASYSNLSDWITNVEHTSYGLGFSMLGESYANFGWFGVIGVFFVGWFVFYMLSCNWLPKKIGSYANLFATYALYIFATTGRGAMYLSVRYVLYIMIVPAMVIYFLSGRKND